MIHPVIAEHLTSDDDATLWELATRTLLADAEALAKDAEEEVYAEIGCCHHWIRPHTSAFGYDKTTDGWSYRAWPELAWSEFLKWENDAWEPGRTGKRRLTFRISIPARSARHRQATVHTVWTPRSPSAKEKAVQTYGFRQREGEWSLAATEAIRPRR